MLTKNLNFEKKKKWNRILKEEAIAEEESYIVDGQSVDIEPFNLKEERKAGYFDAEGFDFFIFVFIFVHSHRKIIWNV